MAARAILIVRVDNATVVRESLNRHPCDGGGRPMRHAKTLISTAVAGIGLALVTACLAAAPLYAAPASRPERSGVWRGMACPQPPPRVLPDSVTPETTCVPPTVRLLRRDAQPGGLRRLRPAELVG